MRMRDRGVLLGVLLLVMGGSAELLAGGPRLPVRGQPTAPPLATPVSHAVPPGRGEGESWPARTTPLEAQQTTFETPDGLTHWRQDVNSGCLYADHNYTLAIPEDPEDLSRISLRMTNWDVDYNDPQQCVGGPEVDTTRFNGSLLGILTGANNSWSINTWPLTRAQMVNGSNTIFIDTDSTATGCWCVGVGYVEVVAKVKFKVESHTPRRDEKNRDFHAGKLDLTVTFTKEYDPASLTATTFLLQYRNRAGAWVQVPGTFTQLAPDRFRFVPGADLKDGIRYRVTVKSGASGVKGKYGGTLTADYVWSFWTVPDLSKTDAFDYGSGSTCPPATSPCPGVEIAAFQTARNKMLVPGKIAIARLYLRWKEHADVHRDDQVKEMEMEGKLTVDGQTDTVRRTRERPDRWTALQKQLAVQTANFFNFPRHAFAYSVEVTPLPQANATPVTYTQTLNLTGKPSAPTMNFDYYFLKDGLWAAGVPAAAKTDGNATMTAGAEFITDQWPVGATSFHARGDHRIGYTLTGNNVNDPSCGTVKEVNCPGSGRKAELWCAFEKLRTMLGGHKFVAATVPNNLCVGATAFAIANQVFMHQSGSGANEGTIAHEVGHIYGISTANNPNNGHRNDSTGVEGFQVRSFVNRSKTENPTKAISLMHTTLQPTGTQWVHNDDFQTLLAAAISRPAGRQAQTPGYLIVTGDVDTVAGTVTLAPSFLQELPNDATATIGPCLAELRDAGDAVVSAAVFTPGVEITVDRPDGSSRSVSPGRAGAVGPQPFGVSLAWSPGAQKLQVSCDGTPLHTLLRTSASPTVGFVGLADGATLSGPVTVSWSGSDTDSPSLAYQLQLSDDGLTWRPLMPVVPETSLSLDTSLLGSGASQQLRVMATDGFNTSHDTRAVSIVNPLTVQGMLPADGATGVADTTPATATFVSHVDVASLGSSPITLLEGTTEVNGGWEYNGPGRTLTLLPVDTLLPSTTYTAVLSPALRDTAGNALAGPTQWSFTTAADTTPPQVNATSPGLNEAEAPQNPIVIAQFDEPVAAATVSGASFQLLDPAGTPVGATVSYNTSVDQAVLLPSAPLQPDASYTARVDTTVTDLAGNPLAAPFEWSFSTGSTTTPGLARMTGEFVDRPFDNDGDSFYDALVVWVVVEVRGSGTYTLNGRLLDRYGTLIQWQTSGAYALGPGAYSFPLVFDGATIRSNGVDGPFTLDALNCYEIYTPNLADVRFDAHLTYPYTVASFFAVMTLGGLPDQLLEWNTSRPGAFDLHDFSWHQTLPVTDLTYSVFINSDPTVGVTIDSDARVNIVPAAGVEAESDVTIEARDGQGNRALASFHVSVQRPRAATLVSHYEAAMRINETQPVSVDILDQWSRLVTAPTTVAFSASTGSVAPPSVESAGGSASSEYTAPAAGGTAFVTVTAGDATTVMTITVVAFANGDVNADGNVNVADIFYLINHLFAGGPLPVGPADVNGDTAVNVADIFYLINALFAGGPAPA